MCIYNLPEYTAAIRTLGKAGTKYKRLLNSLLLQSHKPKKIIVYLAKGYEKPSETIGFEEVVYVNKGMVAQRALEYKEVETEWMLLLDDDLEIETDGVERLFKAAFKYNADVVAYDPFPHDKMSFKQKLTMGLLLSSIPRVRGRDKGYTLSCIGTDIYNNKPGEVAWSNTNAGAAFICRKADFLKIKFEEELWLDDSPYAIPDDKVMFYKMYLHGLKILTHYNSGFTHLDAQTSTTSQRESKVAYSLARNNYIFYHLYVWPNLSRWQRYMASLIKPYTSVVLSLYRFLKRFNGENYSDERKRGIRDARKFLRDIRDY